MKVRTVFAGAQAAGAALLWGTAGVASAFTRPTVSPLVLAWARLSLGGLWLAVVVGPRRLARAAGTLGDSGAALAAFSMAAFQESFFAAVKDLGAGPATMISVAAAPAASLLGAWRSRQVSSATRPALAFALVAVVVGLAVTPIRVSGLRGAGWAMASGAAYAGFAHAVESRNAHPKDGLAVVVIALLGGALAMTPMAVPRIGQLFSLRNALTGAYLGLAATALAYAWFAAALAVLGPRVVLAVCSGQPVAATLLACQLLGGPIGWQMITALAITGLSSAWLAISEPVRPHAAVLDETLPGGHDV